MSGAVPFSHPLDALTLPASGRTVTVRATAQECLDLARFLGLESLDSLEARLFLEPVGGKGRRVRVSGTVSASFEQLCSVSAVPVRTSLEEEFARVFQEVAPETPSRRERPADIDFDALEADEPDLMENGVIDAGALLTEELSLRIDPWPRASDAEFSWSDD